ncbi:uncharacterized protein LOC131521463 [Onychostoma macrolepis]|uniref:uncharacterized protein LOC131521463 n=1 Tax=Onychostoma macrolepis TaxID=369639 RepID=UPI00272C04A8|nr:uncharacterized protein LOC131521463 [Onychostoma macrolepis]
MKQWCLVKFHSGGTEVVPHIWLQGEKVFWPPYPLKESGKVRAAIRRREEPKENWQTYEPVRVLISRDTFEEAERCLERYLKQQCDTTDIQSEEESQQPQKRRKKPNLIYKNSDDSDEDQPRNVTLQKLLTTVTELTKEVRDLRQDFREFRQSCRCGQSAGVVGLTEEPLQLPLHSMEELENAEVILQSQEARMAMVARFTVIGGTTLEIRVRRMLVYSMTNELASGLNWAGKKNKDVGKQKRPFKEMALCKCMFDVKFVVVSLLPQITSVTLQTRVEKYRTSTHVTVKFCTNQRVITPVT